MAINLGDSLRNFQTGVTIKREDFTPEVQMGIARTSLGISNRDSQDDGKNISIPKEEYEKLKNYEQFVSNDSVMGHIGEAISRDLYPQQYEQRQQSSQQYIPQQAAPQQVEQPAPAQETTGDSNGIDWNNIFNDGGNDQQSQQQVTAPPVQPQQTHVQAPQQVQQQPQQYQQAPDRTAQVVNNYVTEFTNGLSSEAVKSGFNPTEVMKFAQNINYQDVLELYKMRNQGSKFGNTESIINENRVNVSPSGNYFSGGNKVDPNSYKL